MNRVFWGLLTAACVVSLSTWGAANDDDRRELRAAYGTVKIDGRLDEAWETANELVTNQIVADLTKIEKRRCAVATARLLWNSNHLYLLIDVKDDAISTKNQNAWAQDSVEIFIDENCERSTRFQNDDCQYRVSALGEISTASGGKRDRIRAKVVPITGGYRVEAAIELQTVKAELGRKIGFELQVNNDPGTGQRESITKWNDPHNRAWLDTSTFGTVTLVEAVQVEQAAMYGSGEVKKTAALDAGAVMTAAYLAKPRNQRVPDWARDAVFYQIFPERFRNGDPSNDPTRDSLEFPDIIPNEWEISPWTQEWFERSPWEKKMGDSFYDHGVFHRRYGGDLQGVIDQLDYLSDLGINTIYFNPVFYARSLHKYDGNSFHHIDPHFGPDPSGDFKLIAGETADPSSWKWTAADRLFLQLLNMAHDRNIRVIIDGVFNHTGRDFFAFKDLVKNQQDSPYVSWYMVKAFDDPATAANEFKYKGWWDVETLPEFADNQAGDDLHPEPKKYVMMATRRWMDPNHDGDPSDGIDGWRLDVANEVPNKFWREWNQLVREINPHAYTVAEIWDEAGDYLADCGFSATMNYHGFAFPTKGYLVDNRLPPSQFAKMLIRRMEKHDVDVRYGLQNLMDSHDTDRLASMIVNARQGQKYESAERFDYDVGPRVSARWSTRYDVSLPSKEDRQVQRLVALFQMTYVGAPMLYYGTEAGMDGADDPDDRMPMIWQDLDYQPRSMGPNGPLPQTQAIKFDQDLFRYYRDLIRIRVAHPELRRGSFSVIHADDDANVLVYAREHKSSRIVVCLNRGKSAYAFDPGWLGTGAQHAKPLFCSKGSLGQQQEFDPTAGETMIQGVSGQIWQVPQ